MLAFLCERRHTSPVNDRLTHFSFTTSSCRSEGVGALLPERLMPPSDLLPPVVGVALGRCSGAAAKAARERVQ